MMQSTAFLVPSGLAAGVATLLANNMGPLLNVYLISLKLDKLAFVGTRCARRGGADVLPSPYSRHSV